MMMTCPIPRTRIAAVLVIVSLLLPSSLSVTAFPLPYVSPPSDAWYADWMGTLMPFIRNLTLLDLSLPGTHDTMTFDLSSTVADHANDLSTDAAWLLHEFHEQLQWLDIGDFMRNQSKTQGLNITAQLDAGIRFIDFRNTYTAGPDQPSSDTGSYDWYCLHFTMSQHLSMFWLTQVRDWVQQHPSEVVVIWISKHGDNCGTHYTNISVTTLQDYWRSVSDLFGSLLVDMDAHPVNATTMGTLVDSNQRVVMYVSDYRNVTGENGTRVAASDCLIDNTFASSSSDMNASINSAWSAFEQAQAHINTITKPRNEFYLLSLAVDPTNRLADAALLHYFWLLINVTNVTDSCAEYFHVPGLDSWCPMHLQSAAQLMNFYNQVPLNWVAAGGSDRDVRERVATLAVARASGTFGRDLWSESAPRLPNAIYIDAVDVNGTIRVGPELYGPGYPEGWSSGRVDGHKTASFGYVDVFALVNLRRGCATGDSAILPDCASMELSILARYHEHGLQRWDDAPQGRHARWPLPL